MSTRKRYNSNPKYFLINSLLSANEVYIDMPVLMPDQYVYFLFLDNKFMAVLATASGVIPKFL